MPEKLNLFQNVTPLKRRFTFLEGASPNNGVGHSKIAGEPFMLLKIDIPAKTKTEFGN